MDRVARIQQMLEASPEDAFLRHALALEYIKMGKDDLARALFERILSTDPSYVGSYYHLGKLLERCNDFAGAMHWYSRGMDAAKAIADTHAYNELRAAHDELL